MDWFGFDWKVGKEEASRRTHEKHKNTRDMGGIPRIRDEWWKVINH